MDFTNTISKLLTGTPQSQYAAIAILIAVIAIILSILFNENELTLGERLMLIGSVILFSIPSIILGLFDLTCVAGKTVENSLCWWWGWVIAFIIIIICVIVVFASVSSMLTYNVATSKSIKPVVDETESNKIAKELVKDVPETVKPKVEMPSMSDMTMQQNIQGDMTGNVEGMGGYGASMSLVAEPFRNKGNKGNKEKFNSKKEQFSNYSIEGFEGCEYQGV